MFDNRSSMLWKLFQVRLIIVGPNYCKSHSSGENWYLRAWKDNLSLRISYCYLILNEFVFVFKSNVSMEQYKYFIFIGSYLFLSRSVEL